MTAKTATATATVTISMDDIFAKQEAGTLFDIASELIRDDVGGMVAHNRVCTLLRMCARLSGIHYATLHEAAVERANADREVRRKIWENRYALADHKRNDFNVLTPKCDAISHALRGY